MQGLASVPDWLAPLMDSGVEFLRSLQTLRHPVLNVLFGVVTDLGNTGGYLLLVPVIYWAYSESSGARLITALTITVWINVVIKDLTALPRPFIYGDLENLRAPVEYSFPSGHSQAAASFWLLLAFEMKQRWAWWAGVVIIFLVGFSRLYLGVHFPHDVAIGWILGAAVVLVFLKLRTWVESSAARSSWQRILFVVNGVPLLLLVLHSERNGVIAMGALSGMLTGYTLIHRLVERNHSTKIPTAFKLVVGFGGVVVLSLLIRAGSPAENYPWYLAYYGFGFWILGLWIGWASLRIAAGVSSWSNARR